MCHTTIHENANNKKSSKGLEGTVKLFLKVRLILFIVFCSEIYNSSKPYGRIETA